MSFAEGKRQVAAIVDGTFEAVLSEFAARRFPENAVPCRGAQGAGVATDDYAPNGALEFEVPRGQVRKLVEKVRDYWDKQGYRSIQVVPQGEAVFAQTDGYRLSFAIDPKPGDDTVARATLGAGGPCAKPKDEGERKEPPNFRSVEDR